MTRDILVVGSVAYDTLETPAGKRKDVLGGTATHFSVSASFFAPVHLVGVVGGDFLPEHMEFLQSRKVNTGGLEVMQDGNTFRWEGHYLHNLNEAETINTKLGVFADFLPKLSPAQREMPYLFLGNIHPRLQMHVLEQVKKPKLIALDTMNLWIKNERDAVLKVIEKVDLLFVNEGEARLLTGESNVAKAAKWIQNCGVKTVVIKRGEYGALMFHGEQIFSAPAFPLEEVVDPTGAGDSFAGGFLGHVARAGECSFEGFKQAAICGSTMASFHVEDFGAHRHDTLQKAEVEARYQHFKQLSHFEHERLF